MQQKVKVLELIAILTHITWHYFCILQRIGKQPTSLSIYWIWQLSKGTANIYYAILQYSSLLLYLTVLNQLQR